MATSANGEGIGTPSEDGEAEGTVGLKSARTGALHLNSAIWLADTGPDVRAS